MNKKDHYSTNYEKRFRIKRNNFWLGFFGFFGLSEHSYFNTLKEISTRTATQALQDDIFQLRNDCIKVISDHQMEIDSKSNKKLVNACH
jgi:hypothetical protein